MQTHKELLRNTCLEVTQFIPELQFKLLPCFPGGKSNRQLQTNLKGTKAFKSPLSMAVSTLALPHIFHYLKRQLSLKAVTHCC